MPNRKRGLYYLMSKLRQIGSKFFGGQKQVFIEDVKEDDLPTIARIHGRSFAQGWSDGEMGKMLSNDTYICLLARLAGNANTTPLGFVLIRKILDEAEIITIAVDSGQRRKGIAGKLMREGIRRLQTERVNTLLLEVDQENKGAISLYNNLGFKQISDRKGYYKNTTDNGIQSSTALVMRRELR